MSAKSSVLLPLSQKQNLTLPTPGRLNPVVSSSLSSTPSPTASPLISRNLETLGGTTRTSNLVSPTSLPALSSSSPLKSTTSVVRPLNSSPLVGSRLPSVPLSPVTPVSSPVTPLVSAASRLPPSPKPLAPVSSPVTPLVSSPVSSGSRLPPSPKPLSPVSSPVSIPVSSGSRLPPSPKPLAPVSSPVRPVSAVKPLTPVSSPVSSAKLPPSPRSLPSVSSVSQLPPSPRSLPSVSSVSQLPPSPRPLSPVSSSVSGLPPSPRSLPSVSSSVSGLPPSPRPLSPVSSSVSGLPPSPKPLSATPLPTNQSAGRVPSLPSLPALSSMKLPLSEAKVDKPLVNKPTSVVSNAPSTVSFHDFNGMIEDSAVEKTLTDSGYLPLDKILSKDDNDNLMCQYIKVIDATGRTAFVDLDCEGYVSVDPKDVHLMASSKDVSVVPYSVKMGTYECASNDVCGVAFECDNEVCTLKRTDNSLNPSESVFVHSKVNRQEHGLLSNHPVAYPIVSMSDIKANPAAVARGIKESHHRMRTAGFQQVERDTKELLAATTALEQQVSRFHNIQHLVANSLQSTTSQLEKIHENYKRSPPTTDSERTKLRSVHYNLRKRHDLVIDDLRLAENVNDRTERIRELVGEIKSLNDYADRLFGIRFRNGRLETDIDGVYTE